MVWAQHASVTVVLLVTKMFIHSAHVLTAIRLKIKFRTCDIRIRERFGKMQNKRNNSSTPPTPNSNSFGRLGPSPVARPLARPP
eukprot:scaffold207137_cov28-Tisochrysis_lutea.AAC.1